MSSTPLKFSDHSITSSQRPSWPAQLPALLRPCSIPLPPTSPRPIGLGACSIPLPPTSPRPIGLGANRPTRYFKPQAQRSFSVAVSISPGEARPPENLCLPGSCDPGSWELPNCPVLAFTATLRGPDFLTPALCPALNVKAEHVSKLNSFLILN